MERLENLMEKLREKLNPSRFPEMKPGFAVLVKAILEPRKHLFIDADGIIFDEEGGFLGSRQLLTEFWEHFIFSPKAGLTAEEYHEAQEFLKCCLNHWRWEAPDKKPYMEKFAKAVSIACEVTKNWTERANLIAEIMSPKDRNAIEN
jgi:hypothetical protein